MSNPEEVRCPIDSNHTTQRSSWPAVDADRLPTLPSYACGAYFYSCPTCRPFVLSIRDAEDLELPPEHAGEPIKQLRGKLLENKEKLKALLWEHHTQGLPVPWLLFHSGPYWPVASDRPVAQINVEEFLDRWPVSVTERLDRILLNLGQGTRRVGEACHLGERSFAGGEWFSILFAESEQEADYYIKALEERRLIRDAPEEKGVIVTPEGWARIEELQRTRSSARNPAFVAMWFGDDRREETTSFMTEVFEKHVKRAIAEAGYRVERVDLVPHNDFVMDKVLGMIRVAPFVVADFTGNRNGVYLEAGFARGLGKAVIHTCRKKDFKRAHFDIKQINTIVWDAPEELAEKLYHRIAGTLGLGPYATDSSE